MPAPTQEIELLWKKVVAKSWADPDWKQRLLAEPVAVLREEGVELPEKAKIRILEELPGTRTFVLPLAPDDAWDADLAEKRKNAPCATMCSDSGT